MVVCRAQGLGGTRIKIVARTGHITISLTIVATFCSLVIVMLGSVLTVNFLAGLRNTRSLVGELATQSSGFVTDELRDHLDPVVEQANWVADLVEQDSFDTEEERVSHFLIGAFGGLSQVTSLAFFSKDHRVVQAYRDKAGGRWGLYVGSPRDPDIVEQTLRTGRSRQKGFWNRILFSELTNRSYINYVRPVRRGDEFLGVVMAAVSLNELSEIVSEISEKRRGTVFILSEKDQVVAHPNLTSEHPELSKATPTVGIGRVGDPVLEEFWLATTRPIKGMSNLGDVVLRRTEIAGQRYIFAHLQIEGYGESSWIVGHHIDPKATEAAFRRLHDSALVGVLFLVIGVGLTIYFSRKIAGPIKTASARIARIAELNISDVKELPPSPFEELDSQARSFNAMLGALRWFQTYVPRSLVHRLIKRGDQEIASEERELTILFTDLVGFTSTSETMTARETADLLNHHFALLAKCIEREDGTIDKFIGDALMAFWGAPDEQTDQADRAVRAVCAMAQKVHQDNKLRRTQGLVPVRLRMGLHRGPAVVGNIGAPERMNYTVVGDTVNTAQRMEALGKEIAPEAEIVILASETVISAITIDAEHELVGAFPVKGKARPVQVHRVKSSW